MSVERELRALGTGRLERGRVGDATSEASHSPTGDGGLRAGLAVTVFAATVSIMAACSTSAASQKRSLPKPVAVQVTSVLGSVQMAYKGVRTPLAAGAEVVPGNEVEVGGNSAVELDFQGVHLHVGPSSSLYVLQATRISPAWQLQVVVSGSCHASVTNDVRFIVYTGRAVVTATTVTSFDANSGTDSQSLALKVASGSVLVGGLGGKAVVHAGQTASVAAPTPDQPRPVPVVVS